MLHKSLLGLVCLFLFMACSSNDTIGLAIPKDDSANYFPLAVGNQWDYIFNAQDSISNTITVTDSIGGFESPGFALSSSLPPKEQSIMVQLLSNGEIFNVSNRIVYNGELRIDLPLFKDEFRIPLKNMILLKQNNTEPQKIFELNDNILQMYSINHKNIPLYFDYSVKSYAEERLDQKNIGDSLYHNIITSKLTVNLSIEAEHESDNPITILPDQTVVEIKNYFIEDIGLGITEEQQKYEFINLKTLNFEQDNSSSTIRYHQYLINYNLHE